MTTAKKIVVENPDDPNVRDPEHKHELGGTLGMTIGGVAGGIAAGVAAGATLGAAAGPIGAVAGAAIGGAIAGSAGEAIAREINPTAEELYWSTAYKTRPYYSETVGYNAYRPAYRYGIDSYSKHQGRDFDEIESSLGSEWERSRGTSTLDWEEAREASRDAYDRLNTRN